MIHAYFDYLTTEYPRRHAEHGMLLCQLTGSRAGKPLTTVGVRRMLDRAGKRAGLGPIRPHAFRHSFATAILDATGGNTVIARDAGGWASAATVDQVYAHTDMHDPAFETALRTVWGEPR